MEMNEFRNQLKALLTTLQKLPSSDKQAALELLHLSLNDEVQNSSHSEAEETVPGSLSKKNYTEGNDDNHSMFEETQPLHNNSQQVPSNHEVLLVAALDRENDKEHHPCTSNQVPIHCSQNDFQEKYSTEILHHFSNSRCLEDTVANITGNDSKSSCQKQMNDNSHEESQVVAQNLSVNTVSKEFEDSLSTDHIVQLPTLGSRKVLSTHKDLQERSPSTIAKNIPRIQRSHQYGSNIPTVTKPKYDIHASIPGTIGDYEQQSSNMEKYDAVLEIGAEDKLPGSSHEIIPELTPLCPRYFGNASPGGTELGSLLQPPGQDKHMGSIEDSSNSQAFEGNDSLLTDDGQLRISDMKAQERCGRKMETNTKASSIMFDEGSSSSFNLTNFSHISTRDGLYTEDNQYFLPYLERENYEKGDFKLEKISRKNNYESTCTENSQVIPYANLKYSECCRGQREVPPLNDYESDKNPVDLSSASNIHSSKVSGSVFNVNDFSNFHKSRLKSLHGEDVMFSVELNSRKRKQSQSKNVVKKRIHARTGKKMIIQSDKNNKRLEGKDSSVIEKNFCEIVIDGSMLEKSFESSNATSNSTSSVDESINESRSTFENHHSHPAPNYDNQLQSNMDQLHLGVEECEEESYKVWESSSSLPYPSSNTEQTVCEEVLPRNLRPVCCRTCHKELADISLFPVHQRQCDGHLACPHCHAKFVNKVTYTKHLEGHKRNVCSKCSQSYCSHKKLKAHMKSDHNYNLISKLYPCHKCSRKFLKRSSLYHHLKVHAVGSEVVCQKCGVICVDQESYELHMDEHLKSTKFRCHICTASFKRRQQYDDHLKHHKKNKCEICGQPFTTKRALVRHCRVEHQKLPQNITLDPEYKCDKCNKVFNRPSLLHQHLQLHNGVKLKCSLCDKQFSHRRGLRKHMNSVVHEHMLQTNNMEKDHAYDAKQKLEFMCEYCGIKLPTKITLTKHCRLKHKVGVTWSCPHCDYKTIRNHTLKRHMELHQENRNFMCEICGNSYQALATLKDHHNFVHSDERNYKCSECNKKFKNNSSLARHLRIHSDDRPYQCHCGTSYKRLSHLKRHMSSAHNEILKSRAVKKLKCSEETETIGEKSFKVCSQLSRSEHSDGEDYEIVPVSGSTTSPAIPPEASIKDTSDILLQSQENIILMGENSNSGQGHLITVGDSQIIQLIPSTFYPQDNSFQTVSLVSTNELHGLPIPMSMSSSCYGQGGNSGQVVIEPFCLPQSSDTMVMVPVSQEDHVHLGDADVMRTTLKNLETGTFTPGTILRAVKQDDVKQEMNQSQEGNSSRQVMVEPFSVPQCSEAMAMVSAPQDEHVNMGEPDVIRTLDNENLTSGTIVREEIKHDRKQELRLHPSQNQNELDIASSLDSYDYSSAEPSSNLLPALPPARFITHNHPHVHAHTSTSQLSQDILQPSIICSDFVLPVDNNR